MTNLEQCNKTILLKAKPLAKSSAGGSGAASPRAIRTNKFYQLHYKQQQIEPSMPKQRPCINTQAQSASTPSHGNHPTKTQIY